MIIGSNNKAISDIKALIGTVADEETASPITLFSEGYILSKHMHSVQYCYPTLANGIAVTAAAGTQIKCKLATKAGGATVNFSVLYHTY